MYQNRPESLLLSVRPVILWPCPSNSPMNGYVTVPMDFVLACSAAVRVEKSMSFARR